MKKVLLAGTALLGLAALSTPASAEIKLDLGGFYRFYGVYADNDEAAGAGTSLRSFEFRRDTEIHFNGEATTDNGLTVGVHHELALGGAVNTDETYMYMSGAWGRVNAGQEDGAAYLLQVAAPSADSNVDGLRTYISGLNTNLWNAGYVANSTTTTFAQGYDHADFTTVDRLTYLTPKWNGFQAGVSYAPENAANQNVVGMSLDQDAVGDFEDLWEVAARWDGEFEGFGLSAGAGYSTASRELDVAGTTDDLQTWNAGATASFQGFGLGVVYKTTNNGLDITGTDSDTDTWVVGGSYDNGPYHVGASWLNSDTDAGAMRAGNDFEVDQYTIGGGYTYGPGMTFRGAVAFGDVDDNTVGRTDYENVTQVTVGTDVQF